MKIGMRCGLAALMMVATLTTSAMAVGLDNFQASDVPEPFTDVAEDAWYQDDVETAYQLGLMKGSEDGNFNPNDTLSLGEATALACRLHNIYNGGDGVFEQGDVWYQVYVEYAKENGIATDLANVTGSLDYYTMAASRAQFAIIFYSALPDEALTQINDVTYDDIPDVTFYATYGSCVLKLYQAGILTGSDEALTFDATSNIDRASVATIVSRMAKEENRQILTIERSVELECDESITLTSEVPSVYLYDYVSYDKNEGSWKDITWSSSDESVVTVDDEGMIWGMSEGSAVLTIMLEGESVDMKVYVGGVFGTAYFEEDYFELSIGQSVYLSYTSIPSDFQFTNVTYTSEDTSVAKVTSAGKVTAVGEGMADIYMTADNGEADDIISIYVYEDDDYVASDVAVTSVTLDDSSISLEVGDTKTLGYSYKPTNADLDDIDFSSSNTSVATVSSSGKVTAKSAGTAKITLEIDGKSDTVTVTVTSASSSSSSSTTDTSGDLYCDGIDWNTNYGPVTLHQCLNGKDYGTVTVSTFKFVEVEMRSSYYQVYYQFKATAESGQQYFYVNLVDEDGVVFKEIIMDATDSNGTTIEDDTYLTASDYTRIDQVVLVSVTGHADGEVDTTSSSTTTTGTGSYDAYSSYSDVPDYGELFESYEMKDLSSSSMAAYFYYADYNLVVPGDSDSESGTYRENGLEYIDILEELGYTQIDKSEGDTDVEIYCYVKGTRTVVVTIPMEVCMDSTVYVGIAIFK